MYKYSKPYGSNRNGSYSFFRNSDINNKERKSKSNALTKIKEGFITPRSVPWSHRGLTHDKSEKSQCVIDWTKIFGTLNYSQFV